MTRTFANSLQLLAVAAVVCSASPAVRADAYEDSYNLDPGPGFVLPWPGCCTWTPDNIGWYWTPQQTIKLTAVETILVGLLNGINNDFDLTVTVYTDRPVLGGTVLGSSTFNPGELYAPDPPWHTKPFDTPIVVNAGTAYFVGFSGWDNSAVPGARGGINWATASDYTVPAGARLLGQAYFLDGYADPAGGPDTIPAAPVIKFVGNTLAPVPEPGTWALFGAGLVLLAGRYSRRKA